MKRSIQPNFTCLLVSGTYCVKNLEQISMLSVNALEEKCNCPGYVKFCEKDTIQGTAIEMELMKGYVLYETFIMNMTPLNSFMTEAVII